MDYGRSPRLLSPQRFAKRSVFTHHYWLFGACWRVLGRAIPSCDRDRTALRKLSLNDRPNREETQVQKGAEWISQGR
jgi:hypothetical protein